MRRRTPQSLLALLAIIGAAVGLMVYSQSYLGSASSSIRGVASTTTPRVVSAAGTWKLVAPLITDGSPPRPLAPFVPYANAVAAAAASNAPAAVAPRATPPPPAATTTTTALDASISAIAPAAALPMTVPAATTPITLAALRTTLDDARAAPRCAGWARRMNPTGIQHLMMSYDAVQTTGCEFGTGRWSAPAASRQRLRSRPVRMPSPTLLQCAHGQAWYGTHLCEHENLLFASKDDCAAHARDGKASPSPRNQWGPFATSPIAAHAQRWGGETTTRPPYAVYARDALILDREGPVDTLHERYSPGCSPFHDAIASIRRKDRHGNQIEGPRRAISPDAHAACAAAAAAAFAADDDAPAAPHRRAASAACAAPIIRRAVVIGQAYWDSMYHFLIEVFPRIAPLVDMILADPAMLVHVGNAWPTPGSKEWKQMRGSVTYVPRALNELLGIPLDRLVGGRVFAREVVIPEDGYSHNPLRNMWQLEIARVLVEAKLGIPISAPPLRGSTSGSTTSVLLIERINAPNGRPDAHKPGWAQMRPALEARPGYVVKSFADNDKAMMSCLRCQVEAFATADIVIGGHGAGVSNILFARPQTIVLSLNERENSFIFAELAYQFGCEYYFVTFEGTTVTAAVMNTLDYAEKSAKVATTPSSPLPLAVVSAPAAAAAGSGTAGSSRVVLISIWLNGAAPNYNAVQTWGNPATAKVADFLCFISSPSHASKLRDFVLSHGLTNVFVVDNFASPLSSKASSSTSVSLDLFLRESIWMQTREMTGAGAVPSGPIDAAAVRDARPLFGLMFEHWVVEKTYSHWGWVDEHAYLGDLSAFLGSNRELESFDVISFGLATAPHIALGASLSVFRNSDATNRLWQNVDKGTIASIYGGAAAVGGTRGGLFRASNAAVFASHSAGIRVKISHLAAAGPGFLAAQVVDQSTLIAAVSAEGDQALFDRTKAALRDANKGSFDVAMPANEVAGKWLGEVLLPKHRGLFSFIRDAAGAWTKRVLAPEAFAAGCVLLLLFPSFRSLSSHGVHRDTTSCSLRLTSFASPPNYISLSLSLSLCAGTTTRRLCTARLPSAASRLVAH